MYSAVIYASLVTLLEELVVAIKHRVPNTPATMDEFVEFLRYAHYSMSPWMGLAHSVARAKAVFPGKAMWETVDDVMLVKHMNKICERVDGEYDCPYCLVDMGRWVSTPEGCVFPSRSSSTAEGPSPATPWSEGASLVDASEASHHHHHHPYLSGGLTPDSASSVGTPCNIFSSLAPSCGVIRQGVLTYSPREWVVGGSEASSSCSNGFYTSAEVSPAQDSTPTPEPTFIPDTVQLAGNAHFPPMPPALYPPIYPSFSMNAGGPSDTRHHEHCYPPHVLRSSPPPAFADLVYNHTSSHHALNGE
ncbi:hypothetical protein NLJ89_g4842 [Agrocybe chaxingu]|uniref:Uncharacterized protein n=1 Tax=Agrocybe chaxingu TaxID=84603 RepID=A0A9W8K2G0_9AGAR|nr:hypothetical protein NLJ89_g4842 [Agrocybe chaxingu]